MMRMETRMKVARLVSDDAGCTPAMAYRPGRAPSQVAQFTQVARLRTTRRRGMVEVMPLVDYCMALTGGLRGIHSLYERGGELSRRVRK